LVSEAASEREDETEEELDEPAVVGTGLIEELAKEDEDDALEEIAEEDEELATIGTEDFIALAT
jgi:hypothetical protein